MINDQTQIQEPNNGPKPRRAFIARYNGKPVTKADRLLTRFCRAWQDMLLRCMAATGRGYRWPKQTRDERRKDKVGVSKTLRRLRAHP